MMHRQCATQVISNSNPSLQDSNGKQLVFAVKKGSDETGVLWKATVRVACVKVDAETKEIDSHKTINLKQFLQLHAK